jgi:hypothetical protein
VLHHPRRILPDLVIDPRRRDAVAVLQHWVERDAVVFLRQVLAYRRQAQAMAVEAAKGGVMARAPCSRIERSPACRGTSKDGAPEPLVGAPLPMVDWP